MVEAIQDNRGKGANLGQVAKSGVTRKLKFHGCFIGNRIWQSLSSRFRFILVKVGAKPLGYMKIRCKAREDEWWTGSLNAIFWFDTSTLAFSNNCRYWTSEKRRWWWSSIFNSVMCVFIYIYILVYYIIIYISCMI